MVGTTCPEVMTTACHMSQILARSGGEKPPSWPCVITNMINLVINVNLLFRFLRNALLRSCLRKPENLRGCKPDPVATRFLIGISSVGDYHQAARLLNLPMKSLHHAFLIAICWATANLAAAGEKPNILFILTDDRRWDTIYALGNPETRRRSRIGWSRPVPLQQRPLHGLDDRRGSCRAGRCSSRAVRSGMPAAHAVEDRARTPLLPKVCRRRLRHLPLRQGGQPSPFGNAAFDEHRDPWPHRPVAGSTNRRSRF